MAKNPAKSYVQTGILSVLRGIAARKNNLTMRKRHGNLRSGDAKRLRLMTRALKLSQETLKAVKAADVGRAAP